MRFLLCMVVEVALVVVLAASGEADTQVTRSLSTSRKAPRIFGKELSLGSHEDDEISSTLIGNVTMEGTLSVPLEFMVVKSFTEGDIMDQRKLSKSRQKKKRRKSTKYKKSTAPNSSVTKEKPRTKRSIVYSDDDFAIGETIRNLFGSGSQTSDSDNIKQSDSTSEFNTTPDINNESKIRSAPENALDKQNLTQPSVVFNNVAVLRNITFITSGNEVRKHKKKSKDMIFKPEPENIAVSSKSLGHSSDLKNMEELDNIPEHIMNFLRGEVLGGPKDISKLYKYLKEKNITKIDNIPELDEILKLLIITKGGKTTQATNVPEPENVPEYKNMYRGIVNEEVPKLARRRIPKRKSRRKKNPKRKNIRNRKKTSAPKEENVPKDMTNTLNVTSGAQYVTNSNNFTMQENSDLPSNITLPNNVTLSNNITVFRNITVLKNVTIIPDSSNSENTSRPIDLTIENLVFKNLTKPREQIILKNLTVVQNDTDNPITGTFTKMKSGTLAHNLTEVDT